jgi:ABC-type phosphate/phosphonate transport system substrate-binding protein
MDPLFKKELQSILLDMNKNAVGKDILSHLDIDGFVLGDDNDYDSIRQMNTLVQKQSYEIQDIIP